jgi:FdhD protein
MGSKIKTKIWVVEKGKMCPRSDYLATEEPLEIRLVTQGVRRTIAITMRTPGNDFELAAGFLYSEGIIHQKTDIRRITHCVNRETEIENRDNIVNVELARDELPDLTTLERHFYTTSACGVCGKTSLESLRLRGFSIIPKTTFKVLPEVIYTFPEKLQAAQGIFAATGGLHAAALFNNSGELLAVREDVGRHNALDKLIGWALLTGELPLTNYIIMVSGRSSFEILQKCLVAAVPIVCAVSAPSSLAVQLAQEFGITLIGFLRGEKFNVYANIERLEISDSY